MSTITRYTSRILSAMLTIALLFTSGVTPIFAAEFNNQLQAMRSAESAVNSAVIPEDEMPHEAILPLLDRIDEYETFTQEERLLLYKYLDIGYDETEAAALEAKVNAEFYNAFEALPKLAKAEIKILQMDDEKKVFSSLSNEEKEIFYSRLNVAEDKKAAMDAAFIQLSAQGKSLFESMLLVEISADGLFTLAQAQTLMDVFAERTIRDGQLDAFRSFTGAFVKPVSVEIASLVEARAQAFVTDEGIQLRAEKAEYLTASAFADAKEMFLAGNEVSSIRAAFSVAAVLNLDPELLLLSNSQESDTAVVSPELTLAPSDGIIAPTLEEEAFLAQFPVNLAPVRTQLAAESATSATGQNTMNTAVLMEEASAMQDALFSTLSLDPGVGEIGDDSNVVFPPFQADLTDETGVELNTGAALHEVDLIDIPGRNGHNLRLGIRYSSERANTSQVVPLTGINTGAYLAYVKDTAYLPAGEDLIKYSQNTIMQQFSDITAAVTFMDGFPLDSISVETVENYISHTKVADSYAIERTVITGTYTPFQVTSNVQTSIAPASIDYSQHGYSGTLLPYRSYTIFNSGIVQTGDNVWQQAIEVCVDYTGHVIATTNQLVHTYTDYGIKSIQAYNSVSSSMTSDELNTAIGNGWLWSIPEIYFDKIANPPYAFLYIPNKGTLQFSTTLADGETTYKFSNYTATDLTLHSVSETTDDGAGIIKYYLKLKDGSGYYFSALGRVLLHHDAHGNMITYSYQVYETANGDYEILDYITDTAGRVVDIAYNTNGINSTTRTVTITTPDEYSTVLTLTNLSWMDPTDYALTSITYPDQTQEIFGYTQGIAYFNSLSKTAEYGTAVSYALLTSITYPTGAALSYAYNGSTAVNWNLSGSRTIFRVTERKWIAGGVEYNKQTFTYSGEYTNYPNLCLTLPETYMYSVKVTENNGACTTYFFNHTQRPVAEFQATADGTVKFVSSYTYDDHGFKTYESFARIENNESIATIERYSYDIKGNVLSYLSPKANGDESKKQFLTTYSYSTQNLPLNIVYMQSNNQIVSIQNIYDRYNLIEQQTVLNYQDVQSRSIYTYDAYGRVINQKDYLSTNDYNEIGYTYTGANLTAKTTYNVLDADGMLVGNVTEQYGYDIMGRMTSITDGAGNTTRTNYDSRGRVTSVISPEGRTVTYVYDPVLNTVTESASGMAPIKYTYNALGLLVSETLPTLGVTRKTYTYDNRGRLISESNAPGTTSSGTTYYTYDVWDRLIQKRVTNAVGAQLYCEQTSYTEVNNLSYRAVDTTISSNDTGAPSIHTYAYYTPANELLAEGVYLSEDATYQTVYYYDYASNVISTISPLDSNDVQLISNSYNTVYGQPTTTSVSSLGNSINISSVTYIYDMLGRTTNISPGDDTLILKSYDSLNRQLTENLFDFSTVSSQAFTKYVYDGAGRVIKEKTANNTAGTDSATWKTVEYAYDDDGNLTDTITHVTSTDKQYTHYVYDTAGNLTHEYSGMSSPWTSTMPVSAYKLTSYTYDSRGRLTRLTDGLGQSETYTYDNNDNLLTKTLRDGKQERYTYNALGKIVTDAVYASATATTPLTTRSYTYYPTGALKSVTENGVTLTYTYDARGNVLTESDGTSTKTYTYNIFGGRESYLLKVNNIEIANEEYLYNPGHRLINVYTDNVVVEYAYNMRGNRVSDITSDLRTNEILYAHLYDFDAAGRITGVQGIAEMGDDTLTEIVSESYAYNCDGSMHTKTANGVTTTYTYDGAGRLTAESNGTSTISYTYDASNNRTSMTSGSDVTTYTYDKNNRLLTETTNGTAKSYTYDANGNQLTGDGATYTYNARGQQATYSKSGVTASYTYLPTGLRKSKTVGVITTNYVWDGQNMVYEYNGTNTIGGTAYYYGLTLISQDNNAYYLYNAHGDVVQLVTSTGALGRSYEYDAFGNEVNPSATDTNPFRYAGQYFDTETGTYYLRARYYDPSLGRFTQQDSWEFADPSDPLSLNLYTYCYNNPIMYVDPSGNSLILTTLIVLATGAIIGAGIDASVQLAYNGGQFDQLNWRSIGASAASGAVTSGLTVLTGGASLGLQATITMGALTAGVGHLTYHVVNGSETTGLELLFAMTSGGFVDALGYQASNFSGWNKRPKDLPELTIDNQQFGKKYGEHKNQYPKKTFEDYRAYVNTVYSAPDRIIIDHTKNEYYFIKGNDLLRLDFDGNFISMYPMNNPNKTRVSDAINRGGIIWQKN